MTRILVTGGTGVLGRRVVEQARARGATVRVLSRSPSSTPAAIEQAQGDLTSGAGLDAAFAGVEVVVHCATSQKAGEDLALTRQMLSAAAGATVQHVLYVGIVGIDNLGFYDYYAAKLEGERLVAASGLPYSVQRATQFHDFVAFLLRTLGRLPVLVLPRGVRLQPISPDAVAARIVDAALNGATGRLPDIAGPEIRTLEDLARTWLRATGQRKPLLTLPLPLPIFRAMASGQLVSEEAERLGPSWDTWLAGQDRQGHPSPLQGAVRP